MKFAMLASLALAGAASAAPPGTLRLDYYHTGDATHETFSLGRVVREPLPWPGNPDRPIDTTNLGKYLFEVRDAASGKLLYSRGFASIYGEWETTDEAKRVARTFSESVRFPEPEKPVKVVILKRDAANAFRQVWSVPVDPRDMFVQTAAPPKYPELDLQIEGDPAHKVDLLLLGDGYTKEELPKFEADARRMMELLFSVSPYREHRRDFNVRAICPPAAESGISRPSTGVHRRSPLGASYDAFGSERYVLSYDNRAIRDVACWAPYDAVEILVNGDTYGGGGIFNLYSTVAADSKWAPYIFIHEFGHHFAALADEYYTSDVAYETARPTVEPWEPNVTALLDPAHLKWKDLLTPGTPVPTPWKKEEFEKESLAVQKIRKEIRAQNRPESEMDALFEKERAAETRLLGTDRYSGHVGVFEGADYLAHGYYRSGEDCIMFTRDLTAGFCAACRRAIETIIALDTAGPE